ncbi:oxidoreductase [Aliidongia dinghuensis]|uniref:Oxidoreductase n=1 Tax=Aliidongia dinghuensis TaxID=1867774 RepID=A0A8J3E5L9_9PROT|nr:zinc-binding alcohol dehydrogenase family protein [Aliidongia dinghuensis]GGF48611.1 oxidoreductase [Aliidongia dinghuensis]
MQQLRIHQKAADVDRLELDLAEVVLEPGPGEVLVEVRYAGVNPSDVKAALGLMPHAVWPRTPGRDWAGVVVEGPSDLLGREVWGSGGELGIRRDGSHANHLVLPRAAVRVKPSTMSLAEAGAVGVPFVTAWAGLCRAGLPKAGDNVLVMGGNGKVGQAVSQIATMLGANVFGVDRAARPYRGHASAPVRMIDASAGDIAEVVRAETGGHGADIVYNTVGSPYFEDANQALAIRGRQIFISTIERSVPFDIFAFYRGQHAFFGIDSLDLDSVACAEILERLTPDFERGALKPFPIENANTYPLGDAKRAYKAVLSGARERVVLAP